MNKRSGERLVFMKLVIFSGARCLNKKRLRSEKEMVRGISGRIGSNCGVTVEGKEKAKGSIEDPERRPKSSG